MGSGRDAALTSRLAAIYLEKLLCVGADKGDALRMLNKVLMAKKDEVFTTVDLIEIDKLTGEATLVKAGAAPELPAARRRLHQAREPHAAPRNHARGQGRADQAQAPSGRLPGDAFGRHHAEPQLYACRPPRRQCKELVTALMRRASAQTECADDMSVAALRIF